MGVLRGSMDELKRFQKVFAPYRRRSLVSGDAHAKLYDRAEAAGFQWLGSGGARTVFALSPALVVKVDLDVDGCANRSEDEFYSWAPGEVRPYLAPVLWTSPDDRLLVMPRAVTPVPASFERKRQKVKWTLRGVLPDYDRYDFEYAFNYGVLEGAVVLIDYNT